MKILMVILLGLGVLFGGCEGIQAELVPASRASKKDRLPGRLSIATWNIQTLFDGEEAGTEYDDYLGGAGWNGEKYAARITALSRAIARMADQVPDILAFQETENSRILEDLARGELAKEGYDWSFFANNPGGALGVGVLSRFPFTQARLHSLTVDGQTPPRPVLEVWVEVRDQPLALFVCHWKSKLGGEDATEPVRRASARIILRRLREIEETRPGTAVIVMGDLNENHDEFYRRTGSALCALLPDDPRAAELAGLAVRGGGGEDAGEGGAFPSQADFLVLSRRKPPESVHFREGSRTLYSPWGNELSGGSYHYRGAWETIDHFLLNGALFDGEGWDFDGCQVLNQEPFVNGKGYPDTYNPRTGGGLSDHLPLLLTLKVCP